MVFVSFSVTNSMLQVPLPFLLQSDTVARTFSPPLSGVMLAVEPRARVCQANALRLASARSSVRVLVLWQHEHGMGSMPASRSPGAASSTLSMPLFPASVRCTCLDLFPRISLRLDF